MTLQTKIIGRVQTDHGTYDPNQSYGKKFQVQLFGCVWESLHDNNNTAPAVWDGGDIITPNTTDWKKASGDYQSWLLKQNHPATTGTTGDYPYNGMGRVELAKNMVNTGTELAPVMVNQLTQDMFYKGEVGSRVPNTNTIFVIQYDYVLGENITVPENCILEFEGGSISGAYTLTGNNTGIDAELVKIFNTDIVLAGSWNVAEVYPEWFGAKGDGITNNTVYFSKVLSFIDNVTTDIKTIKLSIGTYCISESIKISPRINIIGIDKYSSIIKKTESENEDDAILELLNGSDSSHYGRFENITLSGVSEQNPNTYGIQATKNSVPYLQIRNVNISGVNNGIYISVGTWLCTIENIFIYEGEKGIYFNGSSTSCRLSNIYVLGMSYAAYEFIGVSYSICDTLCADFCHSNEAVYRIRFSNITFIGCASESSNSKYQINMADGAHCTFMSSTFFHSNVSDGAIINIHDGVAKFVNSNFGYGDTSHPCKIYSASELSTIIFENCEANGTFVDSTGDAKLTVNDDFGFISYKNKQSVLGPASSVPSKLTPNQVVKAIYTDGLNQVSSSQGHSGWSTAFYKGDIILNNIPAKTGVLGWESLNDPRIEKTLVGTISEVVASNRVKLTSLEYNTTSEDGVYIYKGDVLTFNNGYEGEVINIDYINKIITLWDPAGTAAVGEGGKLRTSVFRMKNRFKSIPILGTGVSELRPSSPETGVCYFDETLGKPIWYNGSGWVDATGTTV